MITIGTIGIHHVHISPAEFRIIVCEVLRDYAQLKAIGRVTIVDSLAAGGITTQGATSSASTGNRKTALFPMPPRPVDERGASFR